MMFKPIRHSARLLGIALILTQEDALFIFGILGAPLPPSLLAPFRKKSAKRPGERLASAFERLGPTFIKLGQALSTRSDLIGEEVADDLSRLRDSLPPFSTAQARLIIEEEFGAPVATLFSRFDDAPVAAASIAQVHRAVTAEGRDVAVKILRPNITHAFARDLDLFFWMAEIIERRLKGAQRLKPLEVVRTFQESVFFELDLRFEAAAATELAENLKKHGPGFRVPGIEWGLTSRRVMVMEWIDGIPLSDTGRIRASGFDPKIILGKAARSLFSQVFVDGFFHADLHPGNVFLDKNGDLVAVDFGIMGRLDWKSRLYIAEILRGFLNGDYRHVADIHFTAGYVPPGKSLEAFTQACMAVAKPITGKPVNEISVARLLGQMFAIAAEFEMETQPQLLLLQKTMMVTEGVGRMLDPSLNMWELAEPLIASWASEHFGPNGKLKDAARQGIDLAKKLPAMLLHAENALKNMGDERGIKLHPVSIEAINAGRRALGRAWLTFAWTALGAAILSGLAFFLR